MGWCSIEDIDVSSRLVSTYFLVGAEIKILVSPLGWCLKYL
jgi:hypothetical protein